MAITSATCSAQKAITSALVAYHLPQIQHHRLTITSATNLSHKICQHNTVVKTSAIAMWLSFTTVSFKITGHTNTHTP